MYIYIYIQVVVYWWFGLVVGGSWLIFVYGQYIGLFPPGIVTTKGFLHLFRFGDFNLKLHLPLLLRVVDLTLNQAAKPWFHQYLDPAWYHLWRIASKYF